MSGVRLRLVRLVVVALVASLAWNAYQFRLIHRYEAHDRRVEERVIDVATEAFRVQYLRDFHVEPNLDSFLKQVTYVPADGSTIVSFRTRPLEGGTLHTIFEFRVSNTRSARYDHMEMSGSY